jgi:hypothetical protein
MLACSPSIQLYAISSISKISRIRKLFVDMDALLSLPILGYLVMPGLTTYSTSLNVLFFYMV